MEICGCKASGRHSGDCQRRPNPPPSDLHVQILDLKGQGMNSSEVHGFLEKRNVSVTLAQVNKLYASGVVIKSS